jgi:hypothetical protein
MGLKLFNKKMMNYFRSCYRETDIIARGILQESYDDRDAKWEPMSEDKVKPNTDEDNNKKPLARLLVVDDDPDIFHVSNMAFSDMDSWLMHLPIPKWYYKLSNLIRRASVVDGFIQKPVGIGKLTDKILRPIDETKGWTSLKDKP